MTSIPYIARPEPRETYLNAGHTIRSWLLTRDHKRIAVLYIFSITFFFMIGAAGAALVRITDAPREPSLTIWITDAPRKTGAGNQPPDQHPAGTVEPWPSRVPPRST